MKHVIGGLFLAAALSAAPVSLSGDLKLADAVKVGDKANALLMLKQHADVNVPQADGMTALHWAAYRGDLEMTDLLIRAGAKLDLPTRDGAITPLALAAGNGHAAVVEALLKAGANPNQVFQQGETPLMAAARSGNANAVKSLLDHGANVNAKESVRGQTVLMWAAAENHPEAIKLLLAHGADANVFSNVVKIGRQRESAAKEEPAKKPAADGKPAEPKPPVAVDRALVDLAGKPIIGGYVSRVQFTVVGGLSALLYAARQGNIESAKVLIEAGVDVNQQCAGDQSNALVLAIENGHYDFARYLIEKGANPNIVNMYGDNALYAVVGFRNAEIAWRPNVSTDQQKTQALELMQALLDHGANPNARLLHKLPYRPADEDRYWVRTEGTTPFWRAAAGDDVEAMKLLVKGGADPNIPSDEKVTPLMAASGLGWHPSFSQTWPTHMEAVKLCIELGADVNARDIYGYTAAHGAAYRGDDDVLSFLVEKGAKLHFKSRREQTPWDMAKGAMTSGSLPMEHPATMSLLEKLGDFGAAKLTASAGEK